MRLFYTDESAIDTLLQIASAPVWDGDIVAKSSRDDLHRIGWVARCEGYNLITEAGRTAIRVLKLHRVLDGPKTEAASFTLTADPDAPSIAGAVLISGAAAANGTMTAPADQPAVAQREPNLA